MSEVKVWCFTFGCGQKYANHYVIIKGTFSEAREKMFKYFGTEWCFQYESKEQANVEKWGMKELTLERMLNDG